MQKLLAIVGISCFLFILPGCGTTSSTITSPAGTFTPPTSKAVNPSPTGPGERRLVTATSTDGLHFTPTGKVLTEQANVPDAVVTNDGTIFLYYIGQGIEANKETTAVATSSDNGSTWTYNFLTYKNWPSTRPASDPDVTLLADGTFRMYFTNSLSATKIGIDYADSPDGFTFTYVGNALTANVSVIDSSTFFFDGLWHMFVLGEKTSEQYHATSTDGVTFTLATPSVVTLPKRDYVISNQLIDGATLRMFGFTLGNIRTFTTTDVTTWTAEDIVLDDSSTNTLGSNFIQDMAVTKLNDGTYLMVYVVGYPK